MILVAGATGLLGGMITRQLLDHGKDVRIVVRNGSTYEPLVAAGAQAVPGDLKDQDTLRAACRGIEAVITTANAAGRSGVDNLESVDQHGNRNLIDAATAEGVRQFVFISALGAAIDHPMPLLRAKGRTEEHLQASGMTWTVLQPNFYMDLWIPPVVGVPALAGLPVTLVGDGKRQHSIVAAQDVASYAVAALDHHEAHNQRLYIGGPHPVTWLDVVAAFEKELDRVVPVHTIAPGDLIPGLPGFVSELAAALASYDSPMDVSDLSRTYGVTPTTVADFVHHFTATQRQPA